MNRSVLVCIIMFFPAVCCATKNVIEYPPEALKNCIEGWVILEFNVSKDGEAINPIIIESQPVGVFDQVALKQLTYWESSSEKENENRVVIHGVRNKFTYQLEDKIHESCKKT